MTAAPAVVVAWLDANVILRLLTGQPHDQADRAETLFRRAERGEVRLSVCSIVVAEVTWVLSSVYGVDRRTCACTLLEFLSSDGLVVDEAPVVRFALQTMSESGVDFADAYLAARYALSGAPVASFDLDFARLQVARLEV